MAGRRDDENGEDDGRDRRASDRDVLDVRGGRSGRRPRFLGETDEEDDGASRSRARGVSRDRDEDRPFDRRDRDRRDQDDDRDDEDRRGEGGGREDKRADRDGGKPANGKPANNKSSNGKPSKDKSGSNGKSDSGDKSGDATSGDDAAKDGDDQSDDKQSEERRKKRRPTVYIVGALVLLLLIAGGLYYYFSTRGLVSTDDAYTDGRVVMIAPQIAGQVISLDVADNQFVHKGDPLIHIDPRQYIFTRDQAKGTLDSNDAQARGQLLGVEIAKKNFPATLQLAKANLDASRASLTLASANLARQKGLPKQATTQQEVDQAQASYDQAVAQVAQNEARVTQAEPVQQNIGQSQQQVSELQGQSEQAKARLDQADLNVEWTVVRAPQDGWVTQRSVEAGNYLQAGQQIMSLVTPDIWVTANFKETQLDQMRPGQRVAFKVDAYPDLKLTGHVDSIQRGSGSRFSAFPAQNATGNFVKIVQRVPVKLLIDSGLDPREAMPVGISVEPTVTVR